MFLVPVLILRTKICFPVRTRQEDFILKLNSPGEDEDDEDTDGGREDDLSLGVQSPVTVTITLALAGIRELLSLLTNQRPV